MRTGTAIMRQCHAIGKQCVHNHGVLRHFGRVLLTGIFGGCQGRQGKLGHKDRLAAWLGKRDTLRSWALSPALHPCMTVSSSHQGHNQLGL